MLAFLHTSRAHVETFERLAAEIDAAIPIRHEVQEGLLASVLAGAKAADVRVATTEAVHALARGGAKVVVCTCSTIGAIAEAVAVPDGVVVMRIDRPMAEHAVATGRRIVVVAALATTFEPTLALLRQVAADAKHSIEVVEVMSTSAWPLFEAHDLASYAIEIAKTVEAAAQSNDIVLLAQASMAPAVDLLSHLGIPVLSSPKLGVRAAMSRYRAAQVSIQYSDLWARATVSIWLGDFRTEAELSDYLHRDFSADFGFVYSPPEGPEGFVHPGEPISVRELLLGFSQAARFVDRAVASAAQHGRTVANAAVVFYGARYDPNLARTQSAPLQFIGAIEVAKKTLARKPS